MIHTHNRLSRWAAPLALMFCAMGFSAFLQASVSCVSGQVCTQTIELTPGWNAIYVQIAPTEEATESVFAEYVDGDGPQITSVWTWLQHRAKIDFIQDPDPDNLLSAPGWLRFFPEPATEAFMTNLFAIQANRAYLVNLAGDSSVTLTITGKPVVPKINWESDSFNLVGFHVDPSNLPTFADFVDSSAAHKGQPIYRLVNDAWVQVDPLNTIIQPNVAYWIFSKGGSSYTGPLHVELPQLNRMEYNTVLDSLTPRFQNSLDVSQSVTLSVIGNPPGMFYSNDNLNAEDKWLALPTNISQTIGADSELRFPLGVRRADFTPADFNQTLEVIGTAGSRWLIPVSALAPQLNSLWIGTVTIDQVSQVQNYKQDCDIPAYQETTYEVVDGEPVETVTEVDAQTFALCRDNEGLPITKDEDNVLTDVAAEFSFRVIMHRENGVVRLLKDVIQMRKINEDGTMGDYVLLTDDSLISQYSGVVLRDGEAVGKRVSTMAYDFGANEQGTQINTLDMESGGSFDSVVSYQLILPASAPTNPYGHYYHAQHGKKIINDQPVFKAFDLTRTMAFTFLPNEDGLKEDYDIIGGTYQEVVTGLHKLPIIAAGTFTLRHAAPIDTLN
jgi:hypothetical protein